MQNYANEKYYCKYRYHFGLDPKENKLLYCSAHPKSEESNQQYKAKLRFEQLFWIEEVDKRD
jgi:hypothetical protein